MALYKNLEKMLLKSNLAYPCFCTHERKTESNSEAKKKKKQKDNDSPQNQEQIQELQPSSTAYDGACSKLPLKQIKERILKGQPYAVRIRGNLFTSPDFFVDENYGTVPFVKFDDFVIVKKDGWPTFHFANVVDDWKMQITHVIRGEQWLTNTSKHIYLYKVLGATAPRYLHLPLIQNQSGKKLAKRDPTSSLVTLRNEYEPESIKSFIFRLGWNPKQTLNQKQEIQLLSDEQMIQIFSTQGITKNPARFDIKILNHLNKKALKIQWKQYESLKKVQNSEKSQKKRMIELKQSFLQRIHKHIPQSTSWAQQKLVLIWQILHDRITVNSDIKQYKILFNKEHLTYGSDKAGKDLNALFGSNAQMEDGHITKYQNQKMVRNKVILHNLRLILEHILPQEQFLEQKIAEKISEFLFQNREIKSQQVYYLLRFVITQQKSGPSILKVMMILGRQRCLSIMQNFHNILKTSQAQSPSAFVA